MARKKSALFMTVGAGIKGIEGTESLAHSMLVSIDTNNPDLVIFFGSEESKLTVQKLKEEYLQEFDEEFDFYEFIQIDEIDSFEAYFSGIKSKLLELENQYKIVIDYTSGTKTMTMSAAFASMVCGKRLVFCTGKRENGGIVRGTEKINSQNLYLVYDDLMLLVIKEAFNNNRFASGKALLEDITDAQVRETYSKLFDAYFYFDNVDYEQALEYFDVKLFNSFFPELSKSFSQNIKALSILTNKDHELRYYYLLASMLNNSRRRCEEEKYDDAIARIYRSLELIGQIRLKKEYGISTSDLDLNLIKDKTSPEYYEYLENIRQEDSKIRIGLIQNFNLLYHLDDDLGKFYNENNKRIRNIIKFRNNSVLAHGLESKSLEEYNEFYELVIEAARILFNKIDRVMEETKFPIFKI